MDEEGSLVIIELKRDESGPAVEWQAIKYASYCSSFTDEDIYRHFAEYLGTDSGAAQERIEDFIDCEPADLNEGQRIILVSREFHSEVISAVLWLREWEINIECVRLTPYRTQEGALLLDAEIIIPLPDAKDYIQKKESKQKQRKQPGRSSFSLERSNLEPAELKARIAESLKRPSDLTRRFRAFLELIIREDRPFNREEVKEGLYESGVGRDIGHAGRYLSNISQFLTKKSNPHLRQAVEFETGGANGEIKDNYHVVSQYRDLVQQALQETTQ